MAGADNRASQTLRRAFRERGVQKRVSDATGIDQGRLSHLSRGGKANRENAVKLQESELKVEIGWWDEPPLPEDGEEESSGSQPPTEAA